MYLVKKEMKYYWPAYILTCLATVVIGGLAASLLNDTITFMHGEVDHPARFLLDLFFLGIVPAFGALFISGPYLRFSTIKEDPFSRRTAYYRTMPIPVQVIARSRTLLMLITLVMMIVVFYTVIYIITSLMETTAYEHFFGTDQFIMFMLFWFSYALALGGMNPYVEYGTNGKILHTVPYVFSAVFIATALVFYIVKDQGIVEWSITLIQQYGWNAVIVAAVIALTASVLWHKLLTKRLLHRDYM